MKSKTLVTWILDRRLVDRCKQRRSLKIDSIQKKLKRRRAPFSCVGQETPYELSIRRQCPTPLSLFRFQFIDRPVRPTPSAIIIPYTTRNHRPTAPVLLASLLLASLLRLWPGVHWTIKSSPHHNAVPYLCHVVSRRCDAMKLERRIEHRRPYSNTQLQP